MIATFVLPGGANAPGGGSRVVFRYANALRVEGWSVNVVMPSDTYSRSFWPRTARCGRYWLSRFTRSHSPHRWFTLHPAVKVAWVPSLAVEHAPSGDVVIATAVRTAEMVAGWPEAAGRKFYLVQGYETWDFSPTRVADSWRLPLTKIAVSRWLGDLIANAGERSYYLPNSIDHEAFGMDRPPEERHAPSVLWPHHLMAQKGSADVIAALQPLLRDVPDLRVRAFGVSPTPATGSLRVEYVRNPAQRMLRQLYNQATVAIAPSHAEGWGLPACEALQCGCALAASNIGGHREFLIHEHNALLHMPGDIAALRQNVLRLLRSPELRVQLARQGAVDMVKFQMSAAVRRLTQILRQEVPE